jgi:hypothetical protein
VKVGDLVKLREDIIGGNTRIKGVIIDIDEDDDPIVLWTKWKFPEANFRSHIVVISES